MTGSGSRQCLDEDDWKNKIGMGVGAEPLVLACQSNVFDPLVGRTVEYQRFGSSHVLSTM